MSKNSFVADLTPMRRRQAVAAILARGVLRYRCTARRTACGAQEESANSQQNCLSPAGTPRLPVPTGSGGYAPRDPEKGR